MVVDSWGVRQWLSAALLGLLHQRLCQIAFKMERMLARFQAGKLWRLAPRAVVVKAVAGEVEARVIVAPARIWPTRFAWLVRLGGYRVAGCGGQLQAVLERPEMVALLLAAPQAGRILRPLCRMLAVDRSWLRPRPAGSVVEVAAEVLAAVVKKRVRKPREVIDFGRIPLPRGVLSAARRLGFGRVGSWKGD